MLASLETDKGKLTVSLESLHATIVAALDRNGSGERSRTSTLGESLGDGSRAGANEGSDESSSELHGDDCELN